MKRLAMATLLLVLLLGALSPILADKILTIKTLTGADFVRVNVGVSGGIMTMCGTYRLKDSTGATVDKPKIYCKALTAAQKTTLISFIRDDVGLIAGANAQEGM